MSEWVSVLAVFWILWALDGVRLGPRRLFSLVGWRLRTKRTRLTYARWSVPGVSPWSWRIIAPDVPLAISPIGVCNTIVGAAGRPGETPLRVAAWHWDEIREVGVAEGWVFINGQRFCPDTGHIRAAELLALARADRTQRESRIRRRIASWFWTTMLRRRLAVLIVRSRPAAAANVAATALFAMLTLYVAGGFSARLPSRWNETAATLLPSVLVALLVLHGFAVGSAWRALRILKPIVPEKRRAHLLSAALLPPQALRFRTLLADGFFPSLHPLALALEFADRRRLAECTFNVLTDLRWPLPVEAQSPLAGEISGWFRAALEAELAPRLAAAGMSAEALLASPQPDAPASCTYCPRCHDQFVAGPVVCPQGIRLEPLPGRE